MEEFVTVSVRIRPSFSDENTLQVINKHPAVLLVLDRSQTYHFDNIFSDNVTQADVYNETVKRLVDKVLSGYNCTVFAYGQTGTGKTYTIGTDPDVKDESNAGLISRTLEDFFNYMDEDTDLSILISFIEIYNEKVFDLLGPNNKLPLSVKGFSVQGFKKVAVSSTTEALECLRQGSSKRHTGETKQNLNSSRSHAVFSIHCITRNSERETYAKLNLVDLAGSESVRKTGNQGSSFYEGININKGLLSLGQVMTALSTNSSHVPYRQSIITTILQDSLNKRNFVSLIACVSSNPEDLGETLQTLEFSNRVKKMKNKPEVNEFILQYKKDNPTLFTNNQPKGQTPLKRSNGFSYETPFKKPKCVLPLIREPAPLANNSNFDVSPLFSSSMTSSVSDGPRNFSPVMRKYINAMETSIVNKLTDIIANTLQRPTKVSSCTEDKENMMAPRVLWGEIGNTTNEAEFSLLTSSRSESEDNTPNNSLNNCEDQEANFKVPEPIGIKRKSVRIQNKTSVLDPKPRRSVRLQQLNTPEAVNIQDTTRRRSVRLQMKTPAVSGRREEKQTSNKHSRSPKTPCINCNNKRGKNSKKTKDSPVTVHTKKVLHILNTGGVKELEKLHTVGTKTAEKIYLFRELNGKFNKVSDIAKIPYWTKKKYEKFLAENFLRV